MIFGVGCAFLLWLGIGFCLSHSEKKGRKKPCKQLFYVAVFGSEKVNNRTYMLQIPLVARNVIDLNIWLEICLSHSEKNVADFSLSRKGTIHASNYSYVAVYQL